jgi:hypothetical protein
MIPGDGAVVGRAEQVEQVGRADALGAVARRQRIVKLDGSHGVACDIVDAADHAAVVGEADHARQEALGDAVGHVDALRLAPFGDQHALVDDDSGQVAAILDRTDGVAERFSAEGAVVVELEVARILDLACDGEVDRVFQQLRVDAGLRRRFALPVGARERLRLRHRRHRQNAHQNSREAELHPALLSCHAGTITRHRPPPSAGQSPPSPW